MPHSVEYLVMRLWSWHIPDTSLLTPITRSKTKFLGLIPNILFSILQSLFSSIVSNDCILYGNVYHFMSHTYFLNLFQCDTIQDSHDIAFICALQLSVAKMRQCLCFSRSSLMRSKSFQVKFTEWLLRKLYLRLPARCDLGIRAGIIRPVKQV
jgi:hypothetical protein